MAGQSPYRQMQHFWAGMKHHAVACALLERIIFCGQYYEQCLNTKNYDDIEYVKIKIKSHIIQHENKCWQATYFLYP